MQRKVEHRISRRTTPPLLQGPTKKEKKYDRQLRLWGAKGQQALEEANILLINSGPGVVGIETLKNLILPGIGRFAIADDAMVDESDLGVNFFLTEESLGKPRAEETCRFLQELNPEVKGIAYQKSIDVAAGEDHFIAQHSIVLVVGPVKHLISLSRVSAIAAEFSIPFFYIHSVGFYSHFSIQLPPQFPIIDTHPDLVTTQDLRLLEPWPALQDLVREKTENIENLNDQDHGHIPYVVLLLHYLDVWKASHDGKVPKTYGEKKDFRSLVQAGARTANAEGGEENYDEAVAAVLKSLNKSSLAKGLDEVFASDSCRYLENHVSNFWIIAHAIRQFYQLTSAIPLPGSLPDMKACSDDYIELQNIYKVKAREDFLDIVAKVRKVEGQLNWKTQIDEKEIEAFCKGAAYVKMIYGRRLHCPNWPGLGSISIHQCDYIYKKLQQDESLILLHIAFFAYDLAISQPSDPQNGELPTAALFRDLTDHTTQIFATIQKGVGAGVKHPDRERFTKTPDFDPAPWKARIGPVLRELCRADGAELHNVSALTGGVVAQEVIKVVTKQYIPVDNICVFDGINSKTGVFRL